MITDLISFMNFGIGHCNFFLKVKFFFDTFELKKRSCQMQLLSDFFVKDSNNKPKYWQIMMSNPLWSSAQRQMINGANVMHYG